MSIERPLDEQSFIDGAVAMAKSVSNKLNPLLDSLDYGGHAIASIFKEIGLLDDLTVSDIPRLQYETTPEFRQEEKAKYAK